MSSDQTLPQGVPERRRSQEMSAKSAHPPTEVPGYEPEQLLGIGAYGEVWVAVERNTGRRVAIKFYAHRGGLDWSLLSREVEKLAFLFADRYVVQLIGVGWDADPPYYVMEYLEQGSLADRLQAGPLPVAEAVDLFRDVATGLVHAHGKGVLHCDLKPGNILLDQDNKPRLADFGQSRLSHEQVPALGTLFYMAPEQADLEAVPEARWDVYALGALLYCMLTGSPPHRTRQHARRLEQAVDLRQRLAAYRRIVKTSRQPAAHRRVPGVDRPLAEIVQRCLAPDPEKRYPTVQAVLAALDARSVRRARRPAVVLGAVGPALLLLVVSLFAWWGFSTAMQQSDAALTVRALESNKYAARFVARAAGFELDRRYQAVKQMASSPQFRGAFREMVNAPGMSSMLEQLSVPKPDEGLDPLLRQFHEHPARQALQRVFDNLTSDPGLPKAIGWFANDAHGVQVVRVPENPLHVTIGKNFGWRGYFQGGPNDRPDTWRPAADQHILETHLSPVFRSRATNHWMVAISQPIFDDDPDETFVGIVALMVEVGGFVELQGGADQFAVLVDWRESDNKGLILQHPLFKKLEAGNQGRVPDRFKDYRLRPQDLSEGTKTMEHYRDPLAADPDGGQFDKHWLARTAPVCVNGKQTGWNVIVQESYDSAIHGTLDKLRSKLIRFGLAALAMVVLVLLGLWGLAIRLLNESGPGRLLISPDHGTELPSSSVTTDWQTDAPAGRRAGVRQPETE